MRVERSLLRRAGAPALALHRWRPTGQPAYRLLLVHGTAGHGRCYDEFAEAMRARGVEVWSFDHRGHGESEGDRGDFTVEGLMDDVEDAANAARRGGGGDAVPLIVMGASMGGEIAFQAVQRGVAADGLICSNLLLFAEIELRPITRWLRGRPAAWLGAAVGNRLRVPLSRFVDFAAAYRERPGLWEERRRDPLYTWTYGFDGYRSVFAYRPKRPAAEHRGPTLVCVGERDEVVSAEHVRAAFGRLGGLKDLDVIPRGGHQPMAYAPEWFAARIDTWVRARVPSVETRGERPRWPPAPARVEAAWRGFLDEAEDNAHTPEYTLSAFHRLLVRIDNGSVARGVEFFAAAGDTRLGRFITELVADIDTAAWPEMAPWVPEPVERIAIFGCGDGTLIDRLRSVDSRWARAQIIGFDVDAEAVERGRQRFAADPRVEFRVEDVRRLGTADGPFDLVYAHGIFDHCDRHAEVVGAAAALLRRGGAFAYVTPDRNFMTWLRFVAVGPRWVFKLGHYAELHDFRRFPRPHELDATLVAAGLEPVEDPEEHPRRPWHRGVEYDAGPLAIARAVAKRDRSGLGFRITPPAWWGGRREPRFDGEFIGVALKR